MGPVYKTPQTKYKLGLLTTGQRPDIYPIGLDDYTHTPIILGQELNLRYSITGPTTYPGGWVTIG
jgi:hypothetical protein